MFPPGQATVCWLGVTARVQVAQGSCLKFTNNVLHPGMVMVNIASLELVVEFAEYEITTVVFPVPEDGVTRHHV